jgi:hypothetical protein
VGSPESACAPGYQGRKRGEVVRTRTVILQTHTHQLLGTFGGAGNGDYRGELQRTVGVIKRYATQHGLAPTSILVRLDGLYGDAAPLLDVLSADLTVITRSRASASAGSGSYPTAPFACSRPGKYPPAIRGMQRSLYDCASVPLTAAGPTVRLVIATHAGTSSDPTVGVDRDGTIYELFASTLPPSAFTASDVLDLYLHRGSFETVLADEDEEQEMDRWYSHTPCGKAVCPNFGPMDLESSIRTGTTALAI